MSGYPDLLLESILCALSLWYKEGAECTIETCNMHNRPCLSAVMHNRSFQSAAMHNRLCQMCILHNSKRACCTISTLGTRWDAGKCHIRETLWREATARLTLVFFYLLSRYMRPKGPWQRRWAFLDNQCPWPQTVGGQSRAPCTPKAINTKERQKRQLTLSGKRSSLIKEMEKETMEGREENTFLWRVRPALLPFSVHHPAFLPLPPSPEGLGYYPSCDSCRTSLQLPHSSFPWQH